MLGESADDISLIHSPHMEKAPYSRLKGCPFYTGEAGAEGVSPASLQLALVGQPHSSPKRIVERTLDPRAGPGPPTFWGPDVGGAQSMGISRPDVSRRRSPGGPEPARTGDAQPDPQKNAVSCQAA